MDGAPAGILVDQPPVLGTGSFDVGAAAHKDGLAERTLGAGDGFLATMGFGFGMVRPWPDHQSVKSNTF